MLSVDYSSDYQYTAHLVSTLGCHVFADINISCDWEDQRCSNMGSGRLETVHSSQFAQNMKLLLGRIFNSLLVTRACSLLH